MNKARQWAKEHSDRYTWDKQIALSPNAISLLLEALENFDPEPWEMELHSKLVKMLTELDPSYARCNHQWVRISEDDESAQCVKCGELDID